MHCYQQGTAGREFDNTCTWYNLWVKIQITVLTKNWGCNSDGNFPVAIVAMIIYNCGEMIIVEKNCEKFAEKIRGKNCA